MRVVFLASCSVIQFIKASKSDEVLLVGDDDLFFDVGEDEEEDDEDVAVPLVPSCSLIFFRHVVRPLINSFVVLIVPKLKNH